MLKILVKSTTLSMDTTNKGNQIFKQQVALDLGDGFPLPFYVTRPEGQPYSPGEYNLDMSCFRCSRYGGLEIDPYRVQLVLPLKDAKAA